MELGQGKLQKCNLMASRQEYHILLFQVQISKRLKMGFGHLFQIDLL